MKRITLFSTLNKQNKGSITKSIFPTEIKNKILAYMPSSGIKDSPKQYIDEWKIIAKEFNAKFNVIDNTTNKDKNKLLKSNILVISGGNTFTLLNNLRKSGLDETIQEFATKDEYSIAGFSAGAIVLTPSIAICNLQGIDINNTNMNNFSGLNLVNFEVFPHYDSITHRALFNEYQNKTKNEVKKISDEDYISIDF